MCLAVVYLMLGIYVVGGVFLGYRVQAYPDTVQVIFFALLMPFGIFWTWLITKFIDRCVPYRERVKRRRLVGEIVNLDKED